MALSVLMIAPDARAQSPEDGKLPYRQQPIDYYGSESGDPVARLQQRLEAGDARLEFREGRGYLDSLLGELDVPIASQTLVFAKNSVNARLIDPENPRALYFNDAVYVGWVPGAAAIELSAVDPQKGAMFYTLRQQAEGAPRLVREESCLLCHASSNALGVPGHLVRSFITDPQGNPARGYSRVSHETPLAQRWGGWYVTGDFGGLAHQGNLSTAVDLAEHERNPDGPGRTVELRKIAGLSKYPLLHSDVVALLVLEHQLHGQNLITRVNYEDRLERRDQAAAVDGTRLTMISPMEEKLVRYLLFVDEAPLENPVLGGSSFESWFSKQGPRDRQGRSLRTFDLERRLFAFRCSYLVYSPAFDALPAAAKARVAARLAEVLSATAPPSPYDRLPVRERQAILEILRDTKPELGEHWK